METVALNKPSQLIFPLYKHGYILEGVLNNENRWNTKIVCRIADKNGRRYVSTTYREKSDYLKLLETITYLKCNNKLSPRIVKLYPADNTIICKYIGEFLFECLAENPSIVPSTAISVFRYLEDINSIDRNYSAFTIPPIVSISFELSGNFNNGFEFLPKARYLLRKLENTSVKFTYGCGIEDPHIWNFRIAEIHGKIYTLTTDFDYFSSKINTFWELGYLYATFRWFKKISPLPAHDAKGALLSLVQNRDLKSKFMFWLGVLSSYCGYKDSLCNLLTNGKTAGSYLEEEYKTIVYLDEKVSYLAERLLYV